MRATGTQPHPPSTLQAALLDYFDAPGKYQLSLRQPALLFASVREVLQVAAGRGPAAGAGRLHEAAMFFIRAALLYPGADHYAVLGFAQGADVPDLKERYRLLMRLIHPDYAAAGAAAWPTDAAVRVNRAYEVLSSPVLRRDYDEQLAAQRAPAPARPSFQAAAARRPAPARLRMGRTSAWLLGLALTAAGLLMLLPRQEPDHLVQRARVPAVAPLPPAPPGTGTGLAIASALAQHPAPAVQRAATPPAATAPAQMQVAAAEPAARPLAAPAAAPVPAAPPAAVAAPRAAPAAAPGPAPVAATTPRPAPATAPLPAPTPAPAPVAAAAPRPAPTPAPVAAASRPASAATPTPLAVTAPRPAPAPMPAPAAVAAAAPAPAPPAAPAASVAAVKRVASTPAIAMVAGPTLGEAQPLLTQLLQQLESGSGEQLLGLLDAEARKAPGAQALSRQYERLVRGGGPVHLSQVEFHGEPRGAVLLVTGRIRLHAGEPTIGSFGQMLLLRAEFSSRDGEVRLTGLKGASE